MVWTKDADRDMERLPANVSERIVMAVTRWATSDHGDLKPLYNIPGATHR